MSDVAKWTLLVAGAVVLIGLVVALPFVEFIDLGQFTEILARITEIAGEAFRFGRGLINLFLLPFGREVLSVLMEWFVAKWAILGTIKIGTWIYHFIFK